MMKNFEYEYAQFYDAMHGKKNYTAEARKILDFIRQEYSMDSLSILDFGCGTGKHLNELHVLDERIELSGYDQSAEMISLARTSYPHLNFSSDLQSIKSKNKVVYSLFDVINYQVSDQDLANFFSNISNSVARGGIILLDSWNYSGLKIDPPRNMTREFEYLEKRYSRNVHVSTDSDYRITDLNISVLDVASNTVILDENHRLRAFEPDEVSVIASDFGFGEFAIRSAEDWNSEFNSQDWKFFMTAKKMS